MPLDLPEPDRRQLARSPLQLVVCQIRFEPLPRASDPRVAIAVQERFGGRAGTFPHAEPMQMLTVTPGAASPLTPTTGWRLSSAARDWIITVQSDQASIETTAYTTWGEFRDRLFELIDAVSAELDPASVLRLGLRYSDQVTEPAVGSPAEWERWIARELLGVVLHPRLGQAVLAQQQQVDFDAGDDLKSTLRQGFYRDGQADDRLTYVLDFDSYQEGFRMWDTDALKEIAIRLNDLATRLFQQTITPEMLAYLQGEDGNAGNA
jgi:uncharacterized protein (TIGR04255 family)